MYKVRVKWGQSETLWVSLHYSLSLVLSLALNLSLPFLMCCYLNSIPGRMCLSVLHDRNKWHDTTWHSSTSTYLPVSLSTSSHPLMYIRWNNKLCQRYPPRLTEDKDPCVAITSSIPHLFCILPRLFIQLIQCPAGMQNQPLSLVSCNEWRNVQTGFS